MATKPYNRDGWMAEFVHAEVPLRPELGIKHLHRVALVEHGTFANLEPGKAACEWAKRMAAAAKKPKSL